MLPLQRRCTTAVVCLSVLFAAMANSVHAAQILGFYTFEGSSPAAFNDVSGQGLNPSSIGGATLDASGYQGQAASFSGAASPIAIPTNISPGANANLTIGAWVYADNVGNRGVFGHDNGGWDRGLAAGGNAAPFGNWKFPGGAQHDSGLTVATGEWQFVAVAYNGTTSATIYVDDASFTLAPHSAGVGTASMAIGALDTSGTWMFDGRIDNFFIFDEALSQAQINFIQQHGSNGVLSIAGLIAIPEPSTALLIGVGMAMLIGGRRKYRRSAVKLLIVVACLITTALAQPAAAAIITNGLIQDLNADLGVGTSGSNVTTWANQAASGGDNVATNTAAGTVTLVTGVANGHNAVSFNATAGRMGGTSATAFDGLVGGSGFTWFAVIDADVQAGSTSIFGTLVNGTPFHGMIARDNANLAVNTTVDAPGTTVVEVTGTTNISGGGFQVVAGRLAAGTGTPLSEIFVNSATAEGFGNPAIGALADSGQLAIGAERIGGSQFWNGDIARLLFYDRPLSAAEFNAVGFTLADLYGVSTSFTAPVPEPSTALLIGVGMALLIGGRRKHRKSTAKLHVAVAAVCLFASAIARPAAAAIITDGLIQDLNADVGVATSGSNVVSWTNQAASGGDNVSAAAGTGTATLSTGILAGHNTVTFNGATTLGGSNAAAFDALSNGSGYTWLAVARWDSIAGLSVPFGAVQSVSPFDGITGGINSTGVARTQGTAGAGTTFGSTILSTGQFYLLAGQLQAGTGSILQEVFVNGPTADGSGNVTITGSSNPALFAVGGERPSMARFDGDLARLLIYDRPLTAAEFNNVGFTLAGLYGISTGFTAPVPEPSTALLISLGTVLLASRRRRRFVNRAN